MRKILFLTIGMFALGLDAYVVAGLMPAIRETFKTDSSQIGQLVSVFTLCYALAAPIFATLLAKKPVRRILVLALGIFSIANAASALANSLSWLLIARAIAGIGAGIYSPMAAAAATAYVPKQKKGLALGLMLGGMSTGTVIGVPLGLFIANHVGWQATFWLVTALGFVALIWVLFRLPNISVASPPSFRQRVKMLTNHRVAATIGISFLTSIASLGLYTYLAPILHDSAGIDVIMPYLWAWGVGGVIGSFSVGALIDRTGRPEYLMAGILAIMALVMLTLPLELHFSLLKFLPFLIWGAMGWASQAPQQHTLLALQPDHGASVVALNSSANYLGSAVGAGLGGLVMWAGLSPSRLPLAAGFIALLALLGQLFILLKRWPSMGHQATHAKLHEQP